MTTPTNLSDEALAAELARRQEEARRAQAEEDAARQAERASRAEAVRASYAAEEERLLAAEKEAHEAFRAAVLADPMVAAWVRFRWHRFRRDRLRDEANYAANILGLTERKEPLRWVDSRLLEEVLAVADEEARASAIAESEEVFDSLNSS
ncbi:MAG: hypothetical protein H0U51_00810 [Propionibacteriales bacterium]|nr:hypothetical protein [Propionibacteriales bacterium]